MVLPDIILFASTAFLAVYYFLFYRAKTTTANPDAFRIISVTLFGLYVEVKSVYRLLGYAGPVSRFQIILYSIAMAIVLIAVPYYLYLKLVKRK